MKKIKIYEKVTLVIDAIYWIGESVLFLALVLGAVYKLMTTQTIFPVGKGSAVQFAKSICIILLVLTICLSIVLWKARRTKIKIPKIICFSVALSIFISFLIFCCFLCVDYWWCFSMSVGLLVLLAIDNILEIISNRCIERNCEQEESDNEEI